MRFLADENTDAEWLRALADDGHDVVRVTDSDGVSVGAPDEAVLRAATETDRVLLTADQSDFADPPLTDHPGIVVITNTACSGGNVRRSVRRMEQELADLNGVVAFLGDWL